MAKARHRKPSVVKKNVQRTAVVTTGTALAAGSTLAFPTVALAQDPSAWAALIKCESDFRNVENGVSTASGYFQIIDGTWRGAGGTEFAPRAIEATFEEQATVALRIAEAQGSLADWNASKACWGDEITSQVPSGPAINPNAPIPPPAPAPVQEAAPGPQVVSGGERVVAKAREYFGAAYAWGGESYEEGGFDCSGLVYRVFKDLGVDLGVRTSAAMAEVGTEVASLDQAQPGDLLLFDPDGDGRISHVAIYSGNNKMIDSSDYGDVVREKDVWGTPVTIRHIAVDGEEVISVPAETPVVEETAPVASPEATYTVVEGESLITIGNKLGVDWEVLAELNGLDNPWTIYPGQVLTTQETKVGYEVQPGDWLSTIAPALGTTTRELYAQNIDVIGSNPNLIFPGQVLFVGGLLLPQAPVTVEEAPVVEEEVVSEPAEQIEQAAPVASNEIVPGGRYTSGFGERWGTFHYGIDLAAPVGTPIYTPLGGVVTTADYEWHGGFGAVVYMTADNGDTLWFGHMDEVLVEAGQRVEAGDKIATVGNRGTSTGPHLHFEVHDPHLGKIDPKPWLEARGFVV